MIKEIFQNKKKSIIFFFLTGILVRIVYYLVTYSDSYILMPDSHSYDKISIALLSGDFNFDRDNFIAAPLLPFLLFVLKSIFASNWIHALIILQIIVSSATVYYVWQLSELLFSNRRISLIVSAFYTLYPPLFYFIHSIAQETLFLFFLNAFAFYFVRYLYRSERKDNILAALFFTATYLTKSFISLYVPFMVLLVLLQCRQISIPKRMVSLVQFYLIVLVLVIPVGINNYNHHKVFVTSSNGGGVVFFAANCELNYIDLTNTPSGGTKPYEYGKAPIMTFDFFPNPTYDSIMALPVKVKQDAFWHAGFEWIKENPGKFLKIRVLNFVRLIIPGNSWNRYPFRLWFASFIFGLPLFLLGYTGLFLAIKENWKKHLWILAYLASISVMHIMFIFTNRYRTYTFDLFYGMYAAYALDFLLTKLRKRRIANS